MDLPNTIDSKFRVAIIVARRAKQLINGAKPLVEIEAQNPLSIALEEVNRGLVTMELLDDVNIFLKESTEFSEDADGEAEESEDETGDLEQTENKVEPDTEPENNETENPDPEKTEE